MGNYIPSELLKQRRAFTKKLIWIAPLLTLFISALHPYGISRTLITGGMFCYIRAV